MTRSLGTVYIIVLYRYGNRIGHHGSARETRNIIVIYKDRGIVFEIQLVNTEEYIWQAIEAQFLFGRNSSIT